MSGYINKRLVVGQATESAPAPAPAPSTKLSKLTLNASAPVFKPSATATAFTPGVAGHNVGVGGAASMGAMPGQQAARGGYPYPYAGYQQPYAYMQQYMAMPSYGRAPAAGYAQYMPTPGRFQPSMGMPPPGAAGAAAGVMPGMVRPPAPQPPSATQTTSAQAAPAVGGAGATTAAPTT
eukprot:SAG31_NODE_12482_length_938_cov_1.662694_1_plen_178_part_01